MSEEITIEDIRIDITPREAGGMRLSGIKNGLYLEVLFMGQTEQEATEIFLGELNEIMLDKSNSKS